MFLDDVLDLGDCAVDQAASAAIYGARSSLKILAIRGSFGSLVASDFDRTPLRNHGRRLFSKKDSSRHGRTPTLSRYKSLALEEPHRVRRRRVFPQEVEEFFFLAQLF